MTGNQVTALHSHFPLGDVFTAPKLARNIPSSHSFNLIPTTPHEISGVMYIWFDYTDVFHNFYLTQITVSLSNHARKIAKTSLLLNKYVYLSFCITSMF